LDLTGYGHTGGIDGFSSVFAFFPEGNVSYAMVSNGTRINNNDISIAVLSAVYNKAYKIPEYKTFRVRPADLKQYPGTYSSKEIPLKITVFTEKNNLMAQATGQPAFPLTPSAKHQFVFEQAGIEMEFNPDENTMVLKQVGQVFRYKKD
jgi:D-alanyl-D-alanine carboxypeptidase